MENPNHPILYNTIIPRAIALTDVISELRRTFVSAIMLLYEGTDTVKSKICRMENKEFQL